MTTKLKENKIPSSISIENITVESFENPDGSKTIGLQYGAIGLCEFSDNITEDNIEAIKQEICTIYNKQLIADNTFLKLMARYIRHIDKYNKGMWTNRLDFNTEETYSAFISGLVSSLYAYINAYISDRVANAIHQPLNLDMILTN